MLNKNKLFAQREVNVIPDVSKALSWLEAHPDALKGIGRGIERETLRVEPDGHLATTGHPESLGSALKHDWITTEFAETLLSARQTTTVTFSSRSSRACVWRRLHPNI